MFTIMVVEDDAIIAAELVESLVLLGHDAYATNDPAALSKAPAPDLVLLDLGLGRWDGFEVIELLAAAEFRPPVVIVSGRDQRIVESARRLAVARGLTVIGILPKPFTMAAIMQVLELLKNIVIVPAAARMNNNRPPDPSYVFQSKHDLTSGAIVGYETLLRLPGVDDIERYFADLDAERSLELTMAAAEAAGELQRHFAATGVPLTIAFNCPPDIFGNPDFLGLARDLMARIGVDPARIAIELTEQPGNAAAVDLASMASRYTLAGFQVHLDDFGSGSASLEQLLRLPLSEVKIDRKIFRGLLKEGTALLFEIVALCRKHGITSTIEGIETEDDLIVARQAGADCGQGYFWSRPAAIDVRALGAVA